jgi:hypothetical protein
MVEALSVRDCCLNFTKLTLGSVRFCLEDLHPS